MRSTGASQCRISYASYQCSCAIAEQADGVEADGHAIGLSSC